MRNTILILLTTLLLSSCTWDGKGVIVAKRKLKATYHRHTMETQRYILTVVDTTYTNRYAQDFDVDSVAYSVADSGDYYYMEGDVFTGTKDAVYKIQKQ